MKILVPVKRVADPDNANKVRISADGTQVTADDLQWKPNPFDEYAVETAMRILEDGVGSGKLRGEVIVASIGTDAATQQVRQCLAMGADRGILVAGKDEELDATVVARTLKALVEKEQANVVILGKQAVDGDSNQVGQILAEMLDWPQATFGGQIETDASLTEATMIREVDGGAATMTVKFPAVLTVDLRIVAPKAVKNNVSADDKEYQEGPRYASLRGIMKAKKKPIDTFSLEDLNVDSTRLVNTISYSAPAARSAGVIVETVEELVQKLQNEAKVL